MIFHSSVMRSAPSSPLEVELAAAFLAASSRPSPEAHHPEIPRIGRRSGLARLRGLLDFDGQAAFDAVARQDSSAGRS